MKKLLLLLFVLTMTCKIADAQRRIYNLPDLTGYVTLKCDFHMHTVFSDGNVWPTYRLTEAIRDGLDAFAITDHIEYLPKKDYIPPDYNAAWNIIETAARENNIILVHGAEITREMPPGHLNALFIQDASKLVKDSVYDVIEEAVRQGAFIQWNHPGWKDQEPDGIPKLYELHRKLLENGWINGIEFYNDSEFYPLVLDWCKQFNLAVMGNSDLHDIISETYRPPVYTCRPLTLVFAKERTSESLKKALFAGRTLVLFRNYIAGKEEFAGPFFYKSISIGKKFYESNDKLYFEVTNNTDIPYYLENGPEGASSITLAANSITRIELNKSFKLPLVYDVINVMTGSTEVLKIELKIN
jgi:hypothetical protein